MSRDPGCPRINAGEDVTEKLKNLVSRLEEIALVPPKVIQKATDGVLWPPRPEMPNQEVPDYEKQIRYTDEELEEGVLDYVKATVDPAIWDLETGKLRPKVSEEIIARLNQGLTDVGFKPGWVQQVFVIGSLTGRQYRSDSDLDIEVVLKSDVPDEVVRMAVNHFAENVNGQPLSGTTHPVNYFLTKDTGFLEKADGAYDLLRNEWIKTPERKDQEFDPEKEYRNAIEKGRKVADEILKLTAELRRDVQDLLELRGLNSELADDIQLRKLKEINEGMFALTRIGKILWRKREDAFKKLKKPQISLSNIVYKFVEKSGQLKILHDLARVRNEYMDRLAEVLGVEGVEDARSAGYSQKPEVNS
jgi:hypothetical protein